MPKTRILIIEDESLIALNIKNKLETRGFEVVDIAITAQEAISLTEKHKPDLLLVDIVLSGEISGPTTGISAIETIKSKFDIPFIYLTAHSDDATMQKARLTEPFGYLLKPLNENELYTTIELALYRYDMETRLKASEQKYRAISRERMETLQELQEAKQILENIFSASIPICVIDKDFEVINANDTYCSYFGCSPVETINYKCYDVCRTKLCHTPDCALTRILNGEAHVEYEISTTKNKDKSIHYIQSSKPYFNLSGEITGIVKSYADITNQKDTEQALRISNERFKLIVENIKEIFWMTEPHSSQMLYVSPAYEEIFKRKVHDLINNPQKWMEYIHPDDIDKVKESFKAQEKGHSTIQEYRIVLPDGAIRWIENRTYPVKDNNNEITSITGISENITERKQYEMELQEKQAQLVHAGRLASLGEMATGLAHEINQPLAGISLIVQEFQKILGRRNITDEELNSGLDDLASLVKRMSKTIKHIRTFARQDTLAVAPVVINDSILNAISLLEEQLRLHEISVVKQLDETLPEISGEQNQLEQVWLNLIANARDAVDEKQVQTPDHKKIITISTRYCATSNSVEILIIDNGTGITRETEERVFEPFYTTKVPGKGTGLGLSISYGIIETHGGIIKVKSNEGNGTIASVTLPVTNIKKIDDINPGIK